VSLSLLVLVLVSTFIRDDAPSLRERRPLPMIVVKPGASSSAVFGSNLFRTAEAALFARTGLALEAPEKSGIDLNAIAACPTSELLACYARSVPESTQRLRRKHLLVVTLFDRADKKTTVSSLLIDLEAARAARESIFAGDQDASQRLEDAIFERTTRAPEKVLSLGDQNAVSTYFKHLFEQQLRPMFEATGDFEPYGEIELAGAPPDLEISVDDDLFGSTTGRNMTLREIRPRKVKVELRDPAGKWLPMVREIEVVRGQRTLFEAELIATADPGAAPAVRKAAFWGGIGVAAVGAALAIYAVSAAPDAERVNLEATNNRFATFCELSQDRPGACSGNGVRVAPLGYSMMLGGGTWAAGTALFGEEADWPWVQVVAGLVAGAAAYTVSTAVN
jgi:hypothetical protein